jgi:hypothetical protein
MLQQIRLNQMVGKLLLSDLNNDRIQQPGRIPAGLLLSRWGGLVRSGVL